MEFSVVIGHSQPSWILLIVILSQTHRQCNWRKTWETRLWSQCWLELTLYIWCDNKWYLSLKPTLFQWLQDHWQSSNVYYRFTAVQHQLLKEFYLDHKRLEHKIGNNFSWWPQRWCCMIKILAVWIWITHTDCWSSGGQPAERSHWSRVQPMRARPLLLGGRWHFCKTLSVPLQPALSSRNKWWGQRWVWQQCIWGQLWSSHMIRGGWLMFRVCNRAWKNVT